MLVRGKPAWSMEMLAVLVVLMLVPTWSDGLLLKKCELKSQLEAAFSKLQGEKAEDIIAKLACTVEHISGFNTSLLTITDQSDPRNLIITPFLYSHDDHYSSGIEELPVTSKGTNIVSKNYVIRENVVVTEEPLITLHVVSDDKFIPGIVVVQPEERDVQVEEQDRKQRETPSKDEGNDTWVQGDSSGEGLIDQSNELLLGP
ncbi:hypothetical protein PDJAM_G00161500, partial [Pangasius djambal]|nr:hypothetical protein [Pangasius djambal]